MQRLDIMLINAIRSIVNHNNRAEQILAWKNLPVNEYHNIKAPENWANNRDLECIWIILVTMFGEYGTSPRSGWLKAKNKDAINTFIDMICCDYLEEVGAISEHLADSKFINWVDAYEKFLELMI